MTAPIQLDIIIVGGGFGGIYTLHKLRNLGFKTHLIEAAATLGGVWASNNYPGARVDTNIPAYEFSLPEAYQGFVWNEMYPARDELTRYFTHLDKALDISKDATFNTWISEARWNDEEGQWHVKSSAGGHWVAKYFFPCLGFASKRYTPYIKNLEAFEGPCYHTADFPAEGIDMKNKRVAVIGTGASGVQVIQEVGPECASLTVFQRTGNMALPMVQSQVTPESQNKADYPDLYKLRLTTFSGLLMDVSSDKTFDFTPEQNKAYFDKLYAEGGFAFWLKAYGDLNLDKEANKVAYNYWRDRTRERINCPKLQEILAPTIQAHAFGTKRPSLEMTYWEVYNQSNVELVSLKENPIIEFTKTGIKTQDKEFEFDVIVLATGFEAVTGGFTQIDIIGLDGKTAREQWKEGVKTCQGVAVPNFPNMVFCYGPQGPTAFANGPAAVEAQGDWMVNTVVWMEKNKKKAFYPTWKAAEEWTAVCDGIYYCTLFQYTQGWYNGTGGDFGRKAQSLMYLGGMPSYRAILNEIAEGGYPGFDII